MRAAVFLGWRSPAMCAVSSKKKANIFSLEVVTPVLLEKNELANALTLSGDSQR